MSSTSHRAPVVEAGCLLALAVVLGLVERAFVPPLPVAGIRLGLANLAIIVTLVGRQTFVAARA